MVSRRHDQSKKQDKPQDVLPSCLTSEATSSVTAEPISRHTIEPALQEQPSKKQRLQQPLREITNNVQSLHEHGSGAYLRHVLINVLTSVI